MYLKLYTTTNQKDQRPSSSPKFSANFSSSSNFSMDCSSDSSPYKLFFKALTLVPIHHYILFSIAAFFVFVYNLLEFHFVQDLFTGFRGESITLTFNSSSDVYNEVVSKCKLLHGRYLATPWLSSPHLQTVLLGTLKKPVFNYKRQLFNTADGGTIALDWLMSSDVLKKDTLVNGTNIDDKVPLVIVIPGLTSHSHSTYVKYLAIKIAKLGWNVVVSNHLGLGGVPLTSERFYTAGGTEDLREVINHLHKENPETPLLAVGTSLGANLLVKYLGEDGFKSPIAGAAAISNPWDLLVGDRFFSRGLMQKFYDRVLGGGLKGAAKKHQDIYTRLSDWEGIERSRSVRDFNNYSARVAGNFVSIDSFHRWASSGHLVGNVQVPLLCLNAIDDPVCTQEAIPWDECRVNKNIVLATTQHGGHIAYFEGKNGENLWWVRVVEEFLTVLHSSSLMSVKKEHNSSVTSSATVSPAVNQGTFLHKRR